MTTLFEPYATGDRTASPVGLGSRPAAPALLLLHTEASLHLIDPRILSIEDDSQSHPFRAEY
jgi:hypothetical protein